MGRELTTKSPRHQGEGSQPRALRNAKVLALSGLKRVELFKRAKTTSLPLRGWVCGGIRSCSGVMSGSPWDATWADYSCDKSRKAAEPLGY